MNSLFLNSEIVVVQLTEPVNFRGLNVKLTQGYLRHIQFHGNETISVIDCNFENIGLDFHDSHTSIDIKNVVMTNDPDDDPNVYPIPDTAVLIRGSQHTTIENFTAKNFRHGLKIRAFNINNNSNRINICRAKFKNCDHVCRISNCPNLLMSDITAANCKNPDFYFQNVQGELNKFNIYKEEQFFQCLCYNSNISQTGIVFHGACR